MNWSRRCWRSANVIEIFNGIGKQPNNRDGRALARFTRHGRKPIRKKDMSKPRNDKLGIFKVCHCQNRKIGRPGRFMLLPNNCRLQPLAFLPSTECSQGPCLGTMGAARRGQLNRYLRPMRFQRSWLRSRERLSFGTRGGASPR